MIKSLGRVTDPVRMLDGVGEGELVHFFLSHRQDYKPGAPEVTLEVICALSQHELYCIVLDRPFELKPGDTLETISARTQVAPVNLNQSMALGTVRIPKPWGAEIWYTGIEQRGVCTVGTTPLPWLIAAGGDRVLGQGVHAPLLLKVLDPLPDAVYGDLYFEMHEQKVEVYVVTHIDKQAWPDGEGAIRFGFNKDLVAKFGSREAFSQAYRELVREYFEVRQTIDQGLERVRVTAGFSPTDVVPPATQTAWRNQIDPDLFQREQTLRSSLDDFSTLHPLKVGDVVRIPPFTPHSLQHGVRVVEFQTPHYERYILSFAQKVLTQDHWDTEVAMHKVNWDAAFDKTVRSLDSTPDFWIDEVAGFGDFNVRRLTLMPGQTIEQAFSTYAIVMGIGGETRCGAVTLAPEQAILIPASVNSASFNASGSEASVLLIATPA